ncbi:MAG: hypothetical protein OEZ08_13820 [Betaproteobacteria bacterium]|nr:hypothetical protein [Betaproteobacteria bacterium]
MPANAFEVTGGPCHWDIHMRFYVVVSGRYAANHGLDPRTEDGRRRLRQRLRRLSRRLMEEFHEFFNPELEWDPDRAEVEGEWKLYEFGECPCTFHMDIQVSPLPQELGGMSAEDVLRNLPEHTGIIQIDRLNMAEHPHADLGGKKVVIDEEHIGGSTFPHELGHSLGLPDLYRTGLPGNTITEEQEAQYEGTLMGKKGPLGRRRVTEDDMARIAAATGMTCDTAVCCPDRARKRGKQETEKKPRGGKPSEALEDKSKAKTPGLTPTGAILEFLKAERRK